MKPLRLAIVRQRYNPYGGAERFVERALRALTDQPLALTLIARKWSGRPGFDLKVCDPLHLGRLWRDAGFARCVRQAIAAGGYDLVQSHERIPGCDIYRAGDGVHATWIELLGAQRGVLGRLGLALSPWHRYTLAQEARMFRDPRLRAVICNSRMVRDDIARRFGLGDDRLPVIYNGVDLARFHPGLRDEFRQRTRAELGTPPARPVILFVGSGFERKGVGALLRAAARMQRDAELWIVGGDKRSRDYQRLAGTLGIAGRTRFLGPRDDVRPFYGAADAFALPTLYDPFPNAAVEALACGLPLVTSRSCGAAELVEAGRNGFVCDGLDTAELARHLDCLAAPGAGVAMSEAARQSVARLSLEAMAGELVALYRRLMPLPETATPL